MSKVSTNKVVNDIVILTRKVVKTSVKKCAAERIPEPFVPDKKALRGHACGKNKPEGNSG